MRDVAYIALGSNLGDRAAHLLYARVAIAALPDVRILAESRVEETAPLGGLNQPSYLNQMLAVETTLAPRELLDRLLAIEVADGRVRIGKWGSRTLDLDIVHYDHQTASDSDLTVPHPGLANREFWQRELAELQSELAAR